MAEAPLREQLIHLKNLTERWNVLSEAQVVQLRNYPLLIPNITKAETSINIEKKILTYNCESPLKVFKKTKKVKNAVENIEKYIRFIIWDSVIIEVNVNGKCIYDSRLIENN